jgi:hypothetical protein
MIMKKLVSAYVELVKEIYGYTPTLSEIKNQIRKNSLYRSVQVLKSLKKADEELVQQGVHCHLY